jgi:hypothetical protein
MTVLVNAQTATVKNVNEKGVGSYAEYITHNHSFKVGDTITIGESKKDYYVYVFNNLMPAKDIQKSKATIKSIDIKKKFGNYNIIIKTNKPFKCPQIAIILTIYNIDDAIDDGEIKLYNTSY